MNDDELDALLREAPTPRSTTPLEQPQRVPVWELLAFTLVAAAVLAWVSAALSGIFAG